MQNVKSYINEMFRELPNNKHARNLKSEMLLNMEDRYKELEEQNVKPDDIDKQIISEIGTPNEIRETLTSSNSKRQLVLIGVQLLVVFLLVGFIAYVKINKDSFISAFELYPIALSRFIASPLAIFFGILIVFQTINYINKPKELYISHRWIRFIFLISSVILIGIYCSFALTFLNLIPQISAHLNFFIMDNTNIVATLAGISFYLGTKK